MTSRHNADLLIQRKTSQSQNSSSKLVMSPTTTTKTDNKLEKVPKNSTNAKASVAVPLPSPNSPNQLLARTTRLFEHRARVRVKLHQNQQEQQDEPSRDTWNYALLIALYTLQGIPIGLSASIPFLIQQKMKIIASAAASTMTDSSAAAAAAGGAAAVAATTIASAERLTYRANAIFALCSWPFSLKLLWAPIVDSCFLRSFGRRKSWFVPVQALAGMLMLLGSNFVERQLGLATITTSSSSSTSISSSINVKGITAYFFALYFLFATQDIAVDGYALTLLSKENRGRGPVCNSIGQNIGYFISFVGFLALNDAESCESIWRPLFRLPSNPDAGLVTLGGFLRTMGIFTLVTTTLVAIFKKETATITTAKTRDRKNGANSYDPWVSAKIEEDTLDRELDAAEIGLKETYHRLWAVCQLPSVRWLFLILLTYRLPTSLGDNVKLLKSVEYGLSKTTTAVRTIPLPTLMILTEHMYYIPNDCLIYIVSTHVSFCPQQLSFRWE
jgi:PAT family acetyl-CoA transporter-like MFS transporter 1